MLMTSSLLDIHFCTTCLEHSSCLYTRVLVHVDFVVSSDCGRILMIIVAPIVTLVT